MEDKPIEDLTDTELKTELTRLKRVCQVSTRVMGESIGEIISHTTIGHWCDPKYLERRVTPIYRLALVSLVVSLRYAYAERLLPLIASGEYDQTKHKLDQVETLKVCLKATNFL